MQLTIESNRSCIVSRRRSKLGAARSTRATYSLFDFVLFGCLLLILIFGGASRADVLSSVIIRPIAVLCISMIMLSGLHNVRPVSYWKWLGIVWAGYVACQLIPLPPLVFFSLPGHLQFRAAASDSGTYAVWRPISVVPWATWNALFAMLVPLFGFLFGLRYRSHLDSLLPIFICILGLINLIFGVAQFASNYNSSLYLFDITNSSSITGLFANRNHCAALFCIVICYTRPLMRVLNIEQRLNKLGDFAISACYMCVFCVAAISTGSRTGAAIAVALVAISLAFSGWKHRIYIASRFRSPMPIAICLLFALFLAYILFKYFPFGRWQDLTSLKDGRIEILPQAVAMARAYFPFGGGAGTFPYVYFSFEPTSQMDLTYINHAHNDILESIFEIGIVGAIIITACFARIIHIIYRTYHIKNAGRCNLLVFDYLLAVCVLFLWSFVDYPLRVPALALVTALSLTAAESAFTRLTVRASGKSDLEALHAADKEGVSN